MTKYRKLAKEVRHGRDCVPVAELGKVLYQRGLEGQTGVLPADTAARRATFTCRRGHLGLAGALRAGEKFFQFAGMCKAILEWGAWGLRVMMLSPCLEEYEGVKGHADGPTGADVPGTRQYHYWNDQTGCRMQPASLHSGKRRARVVWDTSAISHPREVRRCLEKRCASKHGPL